MTPRGDPAGEARSRIRRCRTRSTRPAGRSSRRCRSTMFPRLERFDVDFDLPEAFLPEFPPAIFLQNRPELGDVSRGEVVSINNFYRLFKDILTPVQLDGLRLLLTPLAAGGVQPDRRPQDAAAEPGRGLPRLPRQRPHDRAVPPQPGHPPAGAPLPARHDQPARRVQPADPRLEAEPAVGRGLHRVRAAHRLLQRRPDPRHEEGLARSSTACSVSHMAQMQNMFDFPPAPKLDPRRAGSIRPKATESELRGEKLFFGKGQCASCHPAPFYLDHQMHDLQRGAVPRTSPATGRSRPSRSAASRTARRTCTTAAAHAGRHGRVLQPGARREAQPTGEDRPGRLHAPVVEPRCSASTARTHVADGIRSLNATITGRNRMPAKSGRRKSSSRSGGSRRGARNPAASGLQARRAARPRR